MCLIGLLSKSQQMEIEAAAFHHQPCKENPMINRRSFLSKTSVGAVLAPQSFHLLKAQAKGANERLNVAFVGVGNKGAHAIRSLERMNVVNMVAFADVDDTLAAETYKKHPSVPRFRDFRKMLDGHDKDIDAVVISTPDHAHHYIAKSCMQMGKHVYLEKPLAHSIMECRDLAALEKETGLVCQMGNQGHSGSGIAQLEAWYKAGVLGEVTEAIGWNKGDGNNPSATRPPAEPVPSTLDWDLWLGPARAIPYSQKYGPKTWRWWYEFGNGSFGDWACHNMDAPYYILGLECPSSVKIRSTGPSKLSFPRSSEISYRFPVAGGRDVSLKWYTGSAFGPQRPAQLEAGRQLGSNGGGSLIIGTKATVMMDSHAKIPRIIPESLNKELAAELPSVDQRSNHFTNWILSCKGEETPRSHFAYSARLTEAMHYGNIALHVNRDLKIDPVERKILRDAEATQLMSGPAPRKGWKL
jgi:predicted dehydrogenase